MDLKISKTAPVAQVDMNVIKEKPIDNDFSFALNRIGEEGLMTRLSGLIDDITVQGKKIAEHMDIKDLKQYRSMIGDFINEVVTSSHQFSRENFLDRRGRHRVYGIVRLVNKEVDDLAQALLNKEKDHIGILDKVDEIRGLLLDMVV